MSLERCAQPSQLSQFASQVSSAAPETLQNASLYQAKRQHPDGSSFALLSDGAKPPDALDTNPELQHFHHVLSRGAEQDLVQQFESWSMVPAATAQSSANSIVQPQPPLMVNEFLRMQQQMGDLSPPLPWQSEFEQQRWHGMQRWGEEFAAQRQNESWSTEFALQQKQQQQPTDTQGRVGGVDKSLLHQLQNSSNPKMRNSKFVNFLSRLNAGDIELNERDNNIIEKSVSPQSSVQTDSWAEQYADMYEPGHGSSEWARDFQNQQRRQQQRPVASALDSATDWAQQFGSDEEKNVEDAFDWTKQFSDGAEQWANEFEDLNWSQYVEEMHRAKEASTLSKRNYKFADNNPFETCTKPMEEGVRLMKDGDLTHAILAFEQAVQMSASNSEAWRLLGQCNADNEEENQCIAALGHAVELDPYSLESLLMLGVSHTNDLEQTQALTYLKAWLQHNPDYAFLHQHPSQPSRSGELSFEKLYGSIQQQQHPSDSPLALHTEVQDMFLKAASQRPNGEICGLLLLSRSLCLGSFVASFADVDLHTVLGVLFNISGEFDRACECFSRAVELRPDDASLWNKLGATQANGSYSSEAIGAYKRALGLKPNYVRALANLGISFANQGLHREAAQAYLATLQRNPKAEHVWGYLRIALTSLERNDLLSLTDKRDVDAFKAYFHF